MDSSPSYPATLENNKAKHLAYENFKRKLAYLQSLSASGKLTYKPISDTRPITNELTSKAPVFYPRQHVETVPSPPQDLPKYVIDVAKEHNLPLNSIRMHPVIRTTEGVMVFEEYIARIRRALEEGASRSPERDSVEQIFAPRLPTLKRRTIAKHSPKIIPVEKVNSSTIISHMPNHVPPLPADFRKVVMIHNLNPLKLSVNSLFTLCSAFGDVDRVKIMYHKRDTAFVQMASISDANSLMTNLQSLEVWNKCLVLVKSKMQQIHLPDNSCDQVTVNLTKDFSASPDRRFGEKFAQDRASICAPTKYLHFSNLPEEFEIDELKTFLDPEESGLIDAISPLEDQPSMYNVLCRDVTACIEILMFHHANEFQGKKMKISFTAFQEN